MRHEFLLRFVLSPDSNLATVNETKIRTIFPLEISEDTNGELCVKGFCFSESKINSFNLNDISDLIINPQFIDYSK